MKHKQEPIQLKFNCQEDFESMSWSEKGKFCAACQKEVIDFTKQPYLEIQRIREEQPEMCGIFLLEQLDPSLHPIQLPKIRSWAFLSSILVSLNFGNISAQTELKSNDQHVSLNENSLTSADDAIHNTTSLEPSSIENTELAELVKLDREDRRRKRYQKKYVRRKNRSWFWSYRFPFIVKKPTRTRMGVPRWL